MPCRQSSRAHLTPHVTDARTLIASLASLTSLPLEQASSDFGHAKLSADAELFVRLSSFFAETWGSERIKKYYGEITRVRNAVAEIRFELFKLEARQVHVIGHLNRVVTFPFEY